MSNNNVIIILEKIINYAKKLSSPVWDFARIQGSTPYQILISTILSQRTKDEITEVVVKRLFSIADTPYKMVDLNLKEIESLIYPAGFYRNKAKIIYDISKEIIDRYNGEVPSEIDNLLEFKGVGRKTANLVLAKGFNKPAICVDTHVHRISNRIGIVKTKNPLETEKELMKILPEEKWIIINESLVALGQSICKPLSPICSACPINNECLKINVKKSR